MKPRAKSVHPQGVGQNHAWSESWAQHGSVQNGPLRTAHVNAAWGPGFPSDPATSSYALGTWNAPGGDLLTIIKPKQRASGGEESVLASASTSFNSFHLQLVPRGSSSHLSIDAPGNRSKRPWDFTPKSPICTLLIYKTTISRGLESKNKQLLPW